MEQTKVQRMAFNPEFRLQVVLESLQRDTTVEAVCHKYAIVTSVVVRWRNEFKKRAFEVFADKRTPNGKRKAYGFAPGQSPDELKRIIGELTVENEILKKAQELLG
jgi:transposase-like protein